MTNAAQANSGVISIAVSSRIKAAPLCLAQSVDTGAEVLWFRFSNVYGKALDVEDSRLNQIWSPSGVPYPISRFEPTNQDLPDAYLGFEWPLDYFRDYDSNTNTEMVRAVWELIGKKVSIALPASEVPRCEESLTDGRCERHTQAMVNNLFRVALMTVRNLTDAATRAQRDGIWRPEGTFRRPVYNKAANSLREIRKILNQLPRNGLICTDPVPQGCRQLSYPKRELLSQYEGIFKVKLPTALRPLARMYPAERRKFLAELQKQPDKLLVCDR